MEYFKSGQRVIVDSKHYHTTLTGSVIHHTPQGVLVNMAGEEVWWPASLCKVPN